MGIASGAKISGTIIRNAPSTAGNSMTSSERPSPEPILKKEASPAVLGGERILKTLWNSQNALNHRAWGIPAVLSREIPGNALRAFLESFRNFFRKVPAVLGGGYGPYKCLDLRRDHHVCIEAYGDGVVPHGVAVVYGA